MLSSSTYQVERTVAAGSPRALAGFAPVAGAAAAPSDHPWTMSATVIPTTKRHALNPAQRPEEAVPR